MSPPTRTTARGLKVGVVAFAVISVACIWLLSQVEWDATVFVGFGEEATDTTAFAQEKLGDIYLRPGQGHDGKFFFAQANDPWVSDPEVNAAVLDRPLYRSQRMLYPLIASTFGVLGPEQIVWGLLIVNLVAIGLGSFAVASVATAMGMSEWWGLAFLLNVGFISELTIDGAGILAAAAAFGAVAAFLRGQPRWGVALLVVAALSREAMLIAAIGAAWWLWRYRGERHVALSSVAVPIGSVILWAVYLRMRIGWDGGTSEVEEIGFPFLGFARAVADWGWEPSIDLLAGLAIIVLFAVYTRRVAISSQLVGWAFLGFVGLGIVFTEQVWRSYFDITRAVAPIITSFVLLMFAPKETLQRTGVRL